VTSFGSEFKCADKLKTLFGNHYRWEKLRTVLTRGVEFPVSKLEEKTRKEDLAAAFRRGNHASASQKNNILESAISKEIIKGWNIILPVDTYDHLPGAVLNPMGVATHTGISSNGTFVEKDRVTHDLSFPGGVSGESVNSRVDVSQLEPCMFSHVLLRLVHYIVNLRRRHVGTRIWLRKEDFKSAFRRLHLTANSALESSVIVEIKNIKYFIISLRMPFGGSPCPSVFALLADVFTDTINDLLNDEKWDSEELFSEKVNQIPAPNKLNDEIPYAQARSMSVKLPDEDCGKSDVFLDDIISCAVDINKNLDRITKAPITIIDAAANNGSSAGIKRDPLVEMAKAVIEGPEKKLKLC